MHSKSTMKKIDSGIKILKKRNARMLTQSSGEERELGLTPSQLEPFFRDNIT